MTNERMKVLVGIDIQPIGEVEESLRTFGARYRRVLFTDHELESCGDNASTASSLAARFAAKEAVLKILDVEETVPPWRSIEVRQSASGRPEILLHGEAAELARLQGIQDISLSLSHAGGIATAAVVAPVVARPGGSAQ
jgi:holo-[acyl-carrier protein] synthase